MLFGDVDISINVHVRPYSAEGCCCSPAAAEGCSPGARRSCLLVFESKDLAASRGFGHLTILQGVIPGPYGDSIMLSSYTAAVVT